MDSAEGKSLQLNGVNTYLKLSSGSSVVIDKQTDYTIELWFKGDHTNKNATLLPTDVPTAMTGEVLKTCSS